MNILVADKWKPLEIYPRMGDMCEEVCFSQKMFTNRLNIGLPRRAGVKIQPKESK